MTNNPIKIIKNRIGNAHWYILLKDEIKSIEHISSFIFILAGVLGLLYMGFNSKFIQMVIFLIMSSARGLSYYHMLSFNFLSIIWPFVCLIISYDAVYRDLEDERVRMIVSKVSRLDYIMSKLLARLAILITTLAIIALFVMIYTYQKTSYLFVADSFTLFASFAMLSIFLTAIYLMISCISDNPLFVSILIPLISFIMFFSDTILKRYSFYNYIAFNGLNSDQVVFYICGAVIIIMTTMFYFNRKKL